MAQSLASERSARLLIEALRGVLAQVAEPIEVLKRILSQAVLSSAADRGVFAEVNREGTVSYKVLHRFQREELEGSAGQFSRSIFAEVVKTGEPVLIGSARSDPRFMRQGSVQNLTSVLCLPIRVGDRIGALVHLESSKTAHFQQHHLDQLLPLLEIAGPALETLRAGRSLLRECDELRTSERSIRAEAEASRELLAQDWSFGKFVGRSAPVRELEETVRKVAATDMPVLLLGETGTGKSIVARVIHYAGRRGKQPFMTVFCPSLEKGMVEGELFGHKRGAFTDARTDRIGKVQAAEGGTLFLDEIGELPLEIQPKLLRLLQERTFERIGDPQEKHADVRVIAATHRDLERDVQAGRFRRDLYERLNFIPIRIPALRERTGDISLLLGHCLKRYDEGRWVEIAPDAFEYLDNLEFAWPANVRHIEQLAARIILEHPARVSRADIARFLSASSSSETTSAFLVSRDDERPRAPAPQVPANTQNPEVTPSALSSVDLESGLPEVLRQAERAWLQEAIRRYPNLTRAELAARLNLSEASLYRKLRAHEL